MNSARADHIVRDYVKAVLPEHLFYLKVILVLLYKIKTFKKKCAVFTNTFKLINRDE
ncbi:hypothetical protein SAMN06265375_103325 [Muriicola jejuensis]|nr:hypothetical protein SAMN06265375_103325 [Muriicola jejuensis]